MSELEMAAIADFSGLAFENAVDDNIVQKKGKKKSLILIYCIL